MNPYQQLELLQDNLASAQLRLTNLENADKEAAKTRLARTREIQGVLCQISELESLIQTYSGKVPPRSECYITDQAILDLLSILYDIDATVILDLKKDA